MEGTGSRKPAGSGLPFFLGNEGLGKVEQQVLFEVHDVAPTAGITLVLAFESLDAQTPQPRAADGRRIGQRVLDVVHPGKMMPQHSRPVQSGEYTVAPKLAKAGVYLAEFLVNLADSREKPGPGLMGTGSSSRTRTNLSPSNLRGAAEAV